MANFRTTLWFKKGELDVQAAQDPEGPGAADLLPVEDRYLDDGSVASRLMLLEYMTARTHYVPFWDWCLAVGLPLDEESYAQFAEEFGRPELPNVE